MKDKFIRYFSKVTQLTAELSSAKKLQVGAIIVKDNRIISVGYNGMPSGWTNECEHDGKTKPEVLHAETNAIAKVAKSNESCENAVLFCTHTPCIECAKLIYQSGIGEVFIQTEYKPSKGSGEDFLKKCKIPINYLN